MTVPHDRFCATNDTQASEPRPCNCGQAKMQETVDVIEKALAPDLPQWRCHKLVRAAKITGFQFPPDGAVVCLGDIGAKVELAASDLARMIGMTKPKPGDGEAWANLVGGYLVQYEDGYQSWSPAKAFEDGYTAVHDNPVVDATLSFQAMAAAAYDAEWPKDEHHTKLRQLSRALCQKEGHDPDDMVMGGGRWYQHPTKGPNDSFYLRFPLHPVWATYIHRVDDVLAIFHEEA